MSTQGFLLGLGLNAIVDNKPGEHTSNAFTYIDTRMSKHNAHMQEKMVCTKGFLQEIPQTKNIKMGRHIRRKAA